MVSTRLFPKIISPILTNRNPRNLEKMRLGYKPDGYHVDRPGRNFWHKLGLSASGRYVTASVVHFRNGEVIRASTNEWALQRRLFSLTDHSAYVNLARVLARRCSESGIVEVRCDLDGSGGKEKLTAFLETLREGGLVLGEAERYEPDRPWGSRRTEK